MNEQDISKLKQYIDTYLFVPNIGWFKDAFDVQIYSRWAANEILYRMMDEATKVPEYISGTPQRSTIEIVEGFIDEVEYCYEVAEKPSAKSIFYVAANAAKNILILFE